MICHDVFWLYGRLGRAAEREWTETNARPTDWRTPCRKCLATPLGRRHHRSSSYRTLAVPRTRTTLGDRSFAVAGPRVWNSLPATIRQIISYGQFRQHLKIHSSRPRNRSALWLLIIVRYINTLTYLFTYFLLASQLYRAYRTAAVTMALFLTAELI